MQLNGRFFGAPVTKWLLIINVAVYLLDVSTAENGSIGKWSIYGAYATDLCFAEHQYWRLLSFQFLHGGISHLIFNMFAIYMFGGMVERVLGSRRFIIYYLLCGMAGALFYSLLSLIGWLGVAYLVGASAGIFGILIALIVIAPDMQVMLLFPPIPMKMKTFGMIILGIGVYTVLTRGENDGGHAGHLGGAMLGFILMKNPRLLDWVERIDIAPVQPSRSNDSFKPKIRPRTEINLESSEIDRILDKVSNQGVQSLTDDERATLLRISNEENYE